MLILKTVAAKLRFESVLNAHKNCVRSGYPRGKKIIVTHESLPIDTLSLIDMVLNSWESMSDFRKNSSPSDH